MGSERARMEASCLTNILHRGAHGSSDLEATGSTCCHHSAVGMGMLSTSVEAPFVVQCGVLVCKGF